MSSITKAIIPVAGMGTRFLPATKSVAKEMFPIVDIPALMLVLQECYYSGIKDVFIVLCEGKENIVNFLTPNSELEEKLKKNGRLDLLKDLNTLLDNMTFTYGYQQKNCIGSGGAISVAKKWANNQPFAVLFPDDLNYTNKNQRPAIGQLIDAFNQTNSMIIGCKEIPQSEIYKYSACCIKQKITDNLYEINGIIEKPKPGTEPSLISGLARYIMPSDTFDFLDIQIQNSCNNQEIGLTDTMNLICKNRPSYALIMDSIRYDTGDKLGFLKATVEYGLRNENFGNEFRQYLKNLKL